MLKCSSCWLISFTYNRVIVISRSWHAYLPLSGPLRGVRHWLCVPALRGPAQPNPQRQSRQHWSLDQDLLIPQIHWKDTDGEKRRERERINILHIASFKSKSLEKTFTTMNKKLFFIHIMKRLNISISKYTHEQKTEKRPDMDRWASSSSVALLSGYNQDTLGVMSSYKLGCWQVLSTHLLSVEPEARSLLERAIEPSLHRLALEFFSWKPALATSSALRGKIICHLPRVGREGLGEREKEN